MRIKSKGYSYRGYHLGQKVMYGGEEGVIIGFVDTSEDGDDFIAITSSLSNTVKLIESIYATDILDEYGNDTHWIWVSPSEIEVLKEGVERRNETEVEDIPIIRELKDLDGLENGMGLRIKVVGDLFVIEYIKTSDLIRNLKIAVCHVPILKAMGFKFEYRPLRTKEEVLKDLRGLLGDRKDINILLDELERLK